MRVETTASSLTTEAMQHLALFKVRENCNLSEIREIPCFCRVKVKMGPSATAVLVNGQLSLEGKSIHQSS